MSYKFNRDCWVKTEQGLQSCDADELASNGPLSIEVKINRARRLFHAWENKLRSDDRVAGLLRRLEADLVFSRETMIGLGIARACALCDSEQPEGSCCSRGLENKFDVVLLLVNLLLGATLPDTRSRPDSCFFLGSEGCVLRARDILCVEYLCPDLEKALAGLPLQTVQTATGREIETSFRLCEEVKRALRG